MAIPVLIKIIRALNTMELNTASILNIMDQELNRYLPMHQCSNTLNIKLPKPPWEGMATKYIKVATRIMDRETSQMASNHLQLQGIKLISLSIQHKNKFFLTHQHTLLVKWECLMIFGMIILILQINNKDLFRTNQLVSYLLY